VGGRVGRGGIAEGGGFGIVEGGFFVVGDAVGGREDGGFHEGEAHYDGRQ